MLGAYLATLMVSVVMPPWQTWASALSEGYQGTTELVAGTLVAQAGNDKNRVVAADSEHTDALLGVVVANGSSTLEVIGPETSVQVATSGTAVVLVSDLAGAVKAGDAITASPIKGVGMKATAAGRTIGAAKADAAAAGQTATVTTKSGKRTTVNLSTVPISVEVSFFTPPQEKVPYPLFLQNFADTLAGKPVAVVRVLLAAVIMLMAIVIVAFMLFAAIRGALVSIGRNPLAKTAIYRALVQVIITVIGVLGVAMLCAYLLIVV